YMELAVGKRIYHGVGLALEVGRVLCWHGPISEGKSSPSCRDATPVISVDGGTDAVPDVGGALLHHVVPYNVNQIGGRPLTAQCGSGVQREAVEAAGSDGRAGRNPNHCVGDVHLLEGKIYGII